MLTEEQIDTVTSYPDGLIRLMRETGLDQETLDEELLNASVEMCPNCKWYTDSFQLLADDEDVPDGFCDNCRSSDKPVAESEN